MADFIDNANWYSFNFSNEQILQGKQTKFLRFQNNIHNIDPATHSGPSFVAGAENMYIIAIPEIINVDPNTQTSTTDDPYEGQVFFNGGDIQKIQRALKDELKDTNFNTEATDNYGTSTNDMFWYGGPETGTSANDYKQYIPNPSSISSLGYLELLPSGALITQYTDEPINGINGVPLPNPGEKHNFRIDYTGDKPVVVKITFLITTANPKLPLTTFANFAPLINPGIPKDGDVQLNVNTWEYFDGGWNPLGFDTTLGEWPTYGIKHLHEKEQWTPSTLWDGHWFDFQETYIFCYPESTEKPSRETDYWIDKELSPASINNDESSFMLMRTNPKLSGNVKIVIDSAGTMFMDTIEANDELSNAKYKKNKLSPNGSYPVDLHKYFSGLSPEIMYDLKQIDDQYLNAKQTYAEQYDFFYGYGAEQLPSKYYEENFKLFAPLWARKELPDFFVIFKAPGPINQDTFLNNSKETILNEFMSGASIIDTFDMRPGSNLGEYLGKMVNDSRFNEQPLKISYENDTLSTWSGISYPDGILCEKGEFLYDTLRTDQSITDFEEFITTGFQRNQMISSNLFNLEFLFDDEEANDYEINRYFGLYINEIELAKFEIFGDMFKHINGQTPEPKKDVDAEPYSVKPFNQTNLNGIILPVDYYQGIGPIGEPENVGLVQGKLPYSTSVDDPFRVFYVRDRNDVIDRIKSINEFEIGIPDTVGYHKYTGLQLIDTKANISDYAGISKLTTQIPAGLLSKGHSQIVIDFEETIIGESILESLEILEIEWVDINQDKQLWKCVANPTGLQPGDAWDFPVYNPDEFLYVNTFSPEGTAETVAQAFTTCINSFNNKAFEAWNDGSRVYIKSELAGTVGNGFIFRRKLVLNSIIDNVKFYGFKPNFTGNYTDITPTLDGTTDGSLLYFSEDPVDSQANEYEIKIINIIKTYKLIIELSSQLLGGEQFTINGVQFTETAVPALPGDFTMSGISAAQDIIIIQNIIDSTYIPDFASSAVNATTLEMVFTSAIPYTEDVATVAYTFNPAAPSGIGPNDYETSSAQVEVRKNGGIVATPSLVLEGPIVFNTYDDFGIKFGLEAFPGVIYNINDIWVIKSADTTIEQRFIGGNDRNRARSSATIINTENINPLHWFQAQKGKYSRLKQWDVQGNSVYKLPNLENPILDNSSTLSGYADLATDVIIQLSDKDFEFYKTLENKIVGFDAFEPTLGIMSFLPVKDFDFDWILSDYAYSPNAELLRYYEKFEIPPSEYQELELYQSYEITQGEVQLQGWNTITDVWENIQITEGQRWSGNVIYDTISVPNFNTFLPNYYYDTFLTSGKIIDADPVDARTQWNYLHRNYKAMTEVQNYSKFRVCNIGLVDNAIIEKYTYSLDKNLDAFNGFLGLSDFFSSEDENELEILIQNGDIERFFFDQLISEYDRLRENFNKEYAVKSKVVPYINKWTQTGTDCRDNKYRLNTSLAFGITNFSPDTEIRERNPRLHTHEFYYLDEFPDDFPTDLLANSRSHFFQNISEPVNGIQSWYDLFKQNDNDWFSKYFTIGYPTELDRDNGNKVEKKTEQRYITTDFVKGDETVQGLFRGGKFRIIEVDPITGENIPSSKKYDSYKFSSILRIKRLAFDLTEPPAEIEFIANDKFKTILMITTLYISDYRIQAGGYGYTFLYAGADLLDGSNVKFENMNVSSVLDDYAQQSYLTSVEVQRHFDSFFGGGLIKYADIKLSGIFDTSISPINVTPRVLNAITVTSEEFSPTNEMFSVDGQDYDMNVFYNPDAIDFGQLKINVMERGEFSEISQFIPDYPSTLPLNYIINNQAGLDQNIIIDSDKITIAGDFNLPYSSIGAERSPAGFPIRKRDYIPNIPLDNNYVSANAWYLSAGKDYLNKRLEEISYGELLNKINSNDRSVTYNTITDSGIVEGNYFFQLLDFDRIDKQNRLMVIEDLDKPEVYQETSLVGFDIIDESETETIFRHRGRFEPKTLPIVNYWLREDSTMTNHYNIDYLLSNTRFGIEYNNFGILSNLFYSKISDGQLMKISSTSEYKSLYPLIGEVAINNKNFFAFNSNWDNNYYDFYISTESSDPKEGTYELKEQKSFFGSKLMNTPKVYEINTFNDTEITYELSTPLLSTDIPTLTDGKKGAILPDSAKPAINIKLFADTRLIREMIDNGATDEFLKLKALGITRFATLTDDEIIEATKEYLRLNILNLYTVTNVSVYVKSDADEETDEIIRIDLTESQKNALNYILTKDSKINQIEDYYFEIQQEIDTKKYRSFSFSITLERI